MSLKYWYSFHRLLALLLLQCGGPEAGTGMEGEEEISGAELTPTLVFLLCP